MIELLTGFTCGAILAGISCVLFVWAVSSHAVKKISQIKPKYEIGQIVWGITDVSVYSFKIVAIECFYHSKKPVIAYFNKHRGKKNESGLFATFEEAQNALIKRGVK